MAKTIRRSQSPRIRYHREILATHLGAAAPTLRRRAVRAPDPRIKRSRPAAGCGLRSQGLGAAALGALGIDTPGGIVMWGPPPGGMPIGMRCAPGVGIAP